MPHIKKILISLLFLTILQGVFAQQDSNSAKTIVIFLDNSSSMNGNENPDQCMSANYAMQILAATMQDGDKLILVEAHGAFEGTYNSKTDAIAHIKSLNCASGEETKALRKSINAYTNEINPNKYLILIGDGEWFGSSGKEPANAYNFIEDLIPVIKENRLTYISTNQDGDADNHFYEDFYSRKGGKTFLTNSKPDKLQEHILLVVKELLNIGEEGLLNDFYVVDEKNHRLTINNQLPQKKIFIINQKTGAHRSNQQLTVTSEKKEKLNIEENTLGKGDLQAQFITITPANRNSSIEKGKIIIENINPGKIEIYAVSALQLNFSGDNDNFDGNLYNVCLAKDEMKIGIKLENAPDYLSDKYFSVKKVEFNGESYTLKYNKKVKELQSTLPLKGLTIHDTLQAKVFVETKDGSFKKTSSVNITKKACDEDVKKRMGDFEYDCLSRYKTKVIYRVPLVKTDKKNKMSARIDGKPADFDEKSYSFSSIVFLPKTGDKKIVIDVNYNGVNYKDAITLNNRSCLNINIDDKNATLTYSMLETKHQDSIAFSLPPIEIKDNDNKALEEFDKIEIIDDSDGRYTLSKTAKGFQLVKNNRFTKHRFAHCFQSTGDDELEFVVKHKDFDKTGKYKIVVHKTDTGFWVRCKQEILTLIGIIIFLIYLYFVITKPRFHRKSRIIKYRLEDSAPKTMNNFRLPTNFINRYLNPFGVEKRTIDGLTFKAPRSRKSRNIILTANSINQNIGHCSYNGDTIDIGDQFLSKRDPRTHKDTYTDYSLRPNKFIYKKPETNYFVYEYAYNKSKVKR